MNIVITGASKGMGKALAEKFAAAKITFLFAQEMKSRLAETAKEINKNIRQHC